MVADQETPEQDPWARRVPPRAGALVMAAVLLLVGLFFAWQAALLPIGDLTLPGPGFFPFALGVVLSLIALAILVSTLHGRPDGGAVHLGHRNVLIVFLALVGVAVSFERYGTYLTLGTFTAVLLLLVARTSLWRVVLGTTLAMVAVFAFFKVLLGLQLPAGPF